MLFASESVILSTILFQFFHSFNKVKNSFVTLVASENSKNVQWHVLKDESSSDLPGVSKLQSSAWFCMACELRIAFTFVKNMKEKKKNMWQK